MSATGIGAAVRRKEDLRFVTGKGQYTDDVSRPGPASGQNAAFGAQRRGEALCPVFPCR